MGPPKRGGATLGEADVFELPLLHELSKGPHLLLDGDLGINASRLK
jgi:hypothetical protein